MKKCEICGITDNKTRIITSKKFNAVEKITEKMESIDYKCFHKILNSCNYGVAQSRERWFMVCIKNCKKDFVFPPSIELKKTVEDYLVDGDRVRKCNKDLIPYFEDKYKKDHNSRNGLVKFFDGCG